MDVVKKNKILIWTALVLLVLNLATISSIWIERRQEIRVQKKHDHVRSHMHDGVLIKELNLNEPQQRYYEQVRKMHHKNMRLILDSINHTKQLIHTEIFKPQPDTIYINELIENIGKLNTELVKLNYEHFMDIKSHLSNEQKAQFKELMDKMIHKNSIRERRNEYYNQQHKIHKSNN